MAITNCDTLLLVLLMIHLNSILQVGVPLNNYNALLVLLEHLFVGYLLMSLIDLAVRMPFYLLWNCRECQIHLI